MMLSRGLRRLAALAAAFGIALQALWPAIAQARPADSISVPICSVDGTRHEIELPIGKTRDDGSQHCKLCIFGDGKAVSNVFLPFFPLPEEGQQVVKNQSSFQEQLRHLSALPRAPPQVS
jgi:hypothetical protein